MFWDAKKTDKLNEMYNPDLIFLQNGYETYNDFALIASKGYCFEGPFYLDKKVLPKRRNRVVSLPSES